jgi:serine/threonine protein kinase
MNNLILALNVEAKLAIQAYVVEHREAWDQELETTKKVSLFIRHGTSGLPFSIEYWNDHVCLVYPKKLLAMGTTKKLTYAVDIDHNQVYARIKPLASYQEQLKEEVKRLDSLLGAHGIVQNYRSSSYQGKVDSKFHTIQILYDGTLNSIRKSLSDQDLKTMVLDLLAGLAAIHKIGINHNDIDEDNILYRKSVDQIDFVFCDLGDSVPSSQEALFQDVSFLILYLAGIYKKSKKAFPNAMPLPGIDLKGTLSAEKALEIFTEYFQK